MQSQTVQDNALAVMPMSVYTLLELIRLKMGVEGADSNIFWIHLTSMYGQDQNFTKNSWFSCFKNSVKNSKIRYDPEINVVKKSYF